MGRQPILCTLPSGTPDEPIFFLPTTLVNKLLTDFYSKGTSYFVLVPLPPTSFMLPFFLSFPHSGAMGSGSIIQFGTLFMLFIILM
jgi:hypothetical protein